MSSRPFLPGEAPWELTGAPLSDWASGGCQRNSLCQAAGVRVRRGVGCGAGGASAAQ